MSAITTNTQNVAIGSNALGSATGVNNVIAIGHMIVALNHSDSSGTIAIGTKALEVMMLMDLMLKTLPSVTML